MPWGLKKDGELTHNQGCTRPLLSGLTPLDNIIRVRIRCTYVDPFIFVPVAAAPDMGRR
jgi:hypothetical protein